MPKARIDGRTTPPALPFREEDMFFSPTRRQMRKDAAAAAEEAAAQYNALYDGTMEEAGQGYTQRGGASASTARAPRDPGLQDHLTGADRRTGASGAVLTPPPGGAAVEKLKESPQKLYRRLSTKQPAPRPAPEAAAPPPEAAEAASDEAPRCSKRQRGEALPFEQQYDNVLDVGPLSKGLMTFGGRMPHNVYNKLRALYAEKFKEENRALYDEVGGRQFVQTARRHFSEHCTLKVKRDLVQQIAAQELDETATEADRLLKSNAVAVLEVMQAKQAPRPSSEVKTKVAQLTYNSDKFLYPKYNVENVKNCLPSQELEELLRADADVLRLCEYFFDFIKGKAEPKHWEWAASVEISTTVYYTTGKLRLHLAFVFGSLSDVLRFQTPWSFMTFDGVLPVYCPGLDAAKEMNQIKKKGFKTVYGAAMYYLRMPKTGSVASRSSKEPFKDFPIAQTVITSYLQATSHKT